MSKTVTKKKSKQKEIDPKFGVSEWDPAELDVRHTRHGTCCDMGQNDTIGKIELNPSFVLSSNNTNYKNDIQ